MTGEYDSFADALYEEVMGEMAGTFFGTRTRLEKYTQVLLDMADKLRKQIAEVIRQGRILHYLLPEFRALYDLLGLDGERLAVLFHPEADMHPVFSGSAPLALTGAGRYYKVIVRAYEHLFLGVDGYMHGTHSDHPDKSGRKVLSLHYWQVRQFCDNLNMRIRDINQFQSPSEALQVIRTMQPDEMERQRIVGASVNGYAQHLDQEMTLAEVDFASLNLPEFPEFPHPDEIKTELAEVSRQCYAGHRDILQQRMEQIRYE